jgi:hypothetical protein
MITGVRRLVAPAALVVAATVAVAFAPGAGATGPRVIKLVSVTTYEKHIDVPPKADSRGDHDLSASRLINARPQFGKPKGAVVGSDRSVMVLTSPRSAVMKTIARLPGGTLTVNGRLMAAGGGAVQIAVESGTGIFVGAKGTLTVLVPTGPKTVVNIYRLTFPLLA